MTTKTEHSKHTYERVGKAAFTLLQSEQAGDEVDVDSLVMEFPEEERSFARESLEKAKALFDGFATKACDR